MNKLELYLQSFSSYPAVEISLDITKINAVGNLLSPILNIPVELRLHQVEKNKQKFDFQLIEIKGSLLSENQERIVGIVDEFIMQRSFERSSSQFHNIVVLLDTKKIEHLELIRAGKDMSLIIQILGLAEILDEHKSSLEKLYSNVIGLSFCIPQSFWVNNILNKWQFCETHIIEIRKGLVDEYRIPEEALYNLINAEKHFMNWNFKEMFASLYAVFDLFGIWTIQIDLKSAVGLRRGWLLALG